MSITQTGWERMSDEERHAELYQPSGRIAIEARLAEALHAAGNSALGFPGSVDTFRAWLAGHGLSVCLMLKPGEC